MLMLQPITAENWRACIALEATDAQSRFVPTNAESLVQAHYEPENRLIPMGVYEGETLVGFAMYSNPHPGFYAILRLMIDKQHQARGLGRAALLAVVEKIAAAADCESIYMSYDPENIVAARLLASAGFIDEGLRSEGEIVVRLPVV